MQVLFEGTRDCMLSFLAIHFDAPDHVTVDKYREVILPKYLPIFDKVKLHQWMIASFAATVNLCFQKLGYSSWRCEKEARE